MSRTPISLVATCLLALASAGCNTQIEKIFAMQEGSEMQVSIVIREEPLQTFPFPPFALEGGTVMQMTVATTPLDYIDLTVDGDVDLTELLFAMEDVVIILNFGDLCVGLQGPSGGSFEYALLPQTASFDVAIDSFARAVEPGVRQTMGGDAPFPFHLQAEMPLSTVDGLGFFLGTSETEITQEISDFAVFSGIPVLIEGSLTLASQDTFPLTPQLEICAAVVAE